MTSWDYYVGFEIEPELEGLESLLKGEGYIPVRKDNEAIDYESKDQLVELSYFPKAEQAKPREEPNWQEAGFKVVSDLMISTKEDEQEAKRLVYKITKKYNAICYDPQGEGYCRKKDLPKEEVIL